MFSEIGHPTHRPSPHIPSRTHHQSTYPRHSNEIRRCRPEPTKIADSPYKRTEQDSVPSQPAIIEHTNTAGSAPYSFTPSHTEQLAVLMSSFRETQASRITGIPKGRSGLSSSLQHLPIAPDDRKSTVAERSDSPTSSLGSGTDIRPSSRNLFRQKDDAGLLKSMHRFQARTSVISADSGYASLHRAPSTKSTSRSISNDMVAVRPTSSEISYHDITCSTHHTMQSGPPTPNDDTAHPLYAPTPDAVHGIASPGTPLSVYTPPSIAQSPLTMPGIYNPPDTSDILTVSPYYFPESVAGIEHFKPHILSSVTGPLLCKNQEESPSKCDSAKSRPTILPTPPSISKGIPTSVRSGVPMETMLAPVILKHSRSLAENVLAASHISTPLSRKSTPKKQDHDINLQRRIDANHTPPLEPETRHRAGFWPKLPLRSKSKPPSIGRVQQNHEPKDRHKTVGGRHSKEPRLAVTSYNNRIALHKTHPEYTCQHDSDITVSDIPCCHCGFAKIHSDATLPGYHNEDLFSEFVRNRYRKKLDTFGNTPFHYFAASGKATLDMLLKLHKSGCSLQAQNTFGETVLHVLNPARFRGRDLQRLLQAALEEPMEETSRMFIVRTRDIRGRTIFHALASHDLSVDVLEHLFTSLPTRDANASTLFKEAINIRDSDGRTPGLLIFTNKLYKALRASKEATPDPASPRQNSDSGWNHIPLEVREARFYQAWDEYNAVRKLLLQNDVKEQQMREIADIAKEEDVRDLAAMSGPRRKPPHATEQIENEMLDLINAAHNWKDQFAHSWKDLLAEDSFGRNVVQCLAYVKMDPSSRFFLLEKFLHEKAYIEAFNVHQGVDLNGYDVDGDTALLAFITEMGLRDRHQGSSDQNISKIENFIRSARIDGSTTLEDLAKDIQTRRMIPDNSEKLIAFISNSILDMGISDDTSVDTFLTQVRNYGQKANPTLILDELLRCEESRKGKRSSVGAQSGRVKGRFTQRHHSQQLTKRRNIGDFIEEYIRSGADVNLRDRQGQSALHRSVALGLVGCTKALLHHEANIHARDKQGRGVIQVAILEVNQLVNLDEIQATEECIALVEQAGAVLWPTPDNEFHAWCRTCREARHSCCHRPQVSTMQILPL
jgi:Ankyrin repeat